MKILRQAWRRGEWNPGRGLTIRDIVQYETDELGNDIHVDAALLERIGAYPASAIVWATETRKACRRYDGELMHIAFKQGGLVIGDDGPDNGLLILDLSRIDADLRASLLNERGAE